MLQNGDTSLIGTLIINSVIYWEITADYLEKKTNMMLTVLCLPDKVHHEDLIQKVCVSNIIGILQNYEIYMGVKKKSDIGQFKKTIKRIT